MIKKNIQPSHREVIEPLEVDSGLSRPLSIFSRSVLPRCFAAPQKHLVSRMQSLRAIISLLSMTRSAVVVAA